MLEFKESKKDKSENIKYYVNSSKTILFIYDKKENLIERKYKDSWSSTSKLVSYYDKKLDKEIEERIDFDVLINNKTDFIVVVNVVCSTIKPCGYYEETDKYNNLTRNLNEFFGSDMFIKSLEVKKYRGMNIIPLLKEKTPFLDTLIRNLFYNERDEIIINFLNWLNVVCFKDKHQDIFWSFIGTHKELQGQGSGKGFFVQILNEMLSGLTQMVSNDNYKKQFNSILLNKKIIFFDEVEYEKLDYNYLKNTTGNPTIVIEYKGKEPLTVPNVSSWLLFSNEDDLSGCKKITKQDRRMFLIRPNPKNDSLVSVVKDKHNVTTEAFFNRIKGVELEEFVNIISSLPGIVRKPLDMLPTNSHIDYYSKKELILVKDFRPEDLNNIFISEKTKKTLYDIFDVIGENDFLYSERLKDIKRIIDLKVMTRKTFFFIIMILKDKKVKGFSSVSETQSYTHFIQELTTHFNYIQKELVLDKTKLYPKFKLSNVLISKEDLEKNKTHISKTLREIYVNQREIDKIEVEKG